MTSRSPRAATTSMSRSLPPWARSGLVEAELTEAVGVVLDREQPPDIPSGDGAGASRVRLENHSLLGSQEPVGPSAARARRVCSTDTRYVWALADCWRATLSMRGPSAANRAPRRRGTGHAYGASSMWAR